MAKLTKDKLKAILKIGIGLADPDFHLQRAGNRWTGNIISSTFKGKRDHERQKLIWDALAAEIGEEAGLLVGLLLAYTPDEWNLDTKAKKAG
jgi:acid stress-induced BolA-like protein IbaG/YrbA